MVKRILSLLLACCFALALLPVEAWAADSDFVIENGVLTKYRGSGGDVVIPEGVTSIGSRAFECCGLVSVEIPNSVAVIGERAFLSCRQLKSIDIPDGVTYIWERTFECCDSLTSVHIPDSVTGIGSSAFDCCASLVNINIPDDVTSIGDCAFRYCSSLTDVVIPNSVTRIGVSAFYGCSSLVRVTISDNVTNIGAGAFSNCSSITSVTIPSSVLMIGDNAFYGCKGLTEILVEADNSHYSSINGMLCVKRTQTATRLLRCPGGKQGMCFIPNSVTEIMENAFDGCSCLTSVTIPKGITSIEYYTFRGCGLASVLLPNSVTSIGDLAFADCDSLTSIVLPNSVASIGVSAFCCCDILTSAVIGNGMTSIGDEAFEGCHSLTSVVIPDSVTSIGEYAFDGCSSLTDVYYTGNETQWEAIRVRYRNDPLRNATIHYNSLRKMPCLANGTDPSVSKLYVKTFTPNHDNVKKKDIDLTITFNKPIEQVSGSISLYRENSADIITIDLPSTSVSISENTVKIAGDIADHIVSGCSYYVLIESGSFVSTDGDIFYGIDEPEQWEFAVQDDIGDDVRFEWAKKGAWPFKHNDYSKPPVPVATDDECAAVLCKWAKQSGISLAQSETKSMLDKPMYFPVTDLNGSTILLYDNATTVRQVAMDLIFLERLKPYIQELDCDMAAIQPSLIRYDQERAVYQKALGWYGQISRYMKKRAGKSNFFYAVAAPTAYQTLLSAVKEYGNKSESYSYISPMLKGYLKSYAAEVSVKNLQNYTNYTTFKQGIEDISAMYTVGEKAYEAVTDVSIGNTISLGSDLMKRYFGTSDNKMLKEISESWSTTTAVVSAAKVSILMGSSLGLFPLLMDFSTKAFAKLENTAKAFYFIGDYYICDYYPMLYDAIYDDDTCLPMKSNLYEAVSCAELEQASSDPILSNWWELFSTTGVIENEESQCKEMRYDLVNYILFLKYAKSVDVTEQKAGLIRYISAELHQKATTGISVSCPVEIAVYDSTNSLIATLSSKDDTIPQCEYGTLYLMGENNETKYFLLNSDEYHVVITPYKDDSMENSMDMLIVNNAADGTSSHTYYENVSLDNAVTISTNTSGADSEVLQIMEADDQKHMVMPTDAVPTFSVQITAPKRIPVGGSAAAYATTYPAVATNQTVTWTSSNQNVLTVDNEGVLYAQADGSSTIIATAENGVSDSFAVDVYVPASMIRTDTQEMNMLQGETYLLNTDVQPANAEITWTSSDASVAIVDESGRIQALSAGQAILTAASGNVSAEIEVTVCEDLLRVSAYQSDVQGNQIRLSLQNCSCTTDFDGTVFTTIYREDGKMLYTSIYSDKISAKTTKVILLPIEIPSGKMKVKTMVLDKDFAPMQDVKEAVAVG